MSVSVLSCNSWPIKSGEKPMTAPEELSEAMATYRKYYDSRHHKRKLEFVLTQVCASCWVLSRSWRSSHPGVCARCLALSRSRR